MDNVFGAGQGPFQSAATYSDHRYHPYPSTQRRHDHSAERLPMQGPPYQPPQTPAPMGGNDRHSPASSWSPQYDAQYRVSRSNGSYQRHLDVPSPSMTAGEIELLGSRLKLNTAARSALHDFSELPPPSQMVTLFAHVLEIQQNEVAIADNITKTGEKIEQLQKLHIETFRPSAAATAHMRRMSRHFVIQPLQDYLLLHAAVQNYYMRKPHTFRIPTYSTDENVRSVIDPLLVRFGGQARSNYRKVVWKFTGQGASLDVWATFIMRHYDFHGSGAAPKASEMIKARIALARQVALPLVPLPTVKGQSTMFWTKMKAKLVALYKKNGPDIDSTAWKQWAAQIIAADEAAYTEQAVELPDLDGLDMDASGGSASGSASGTPQSGTPEGSGATSITAGAGSFSGPSASAAATPVAAGAASVPGMTPGGMGAGRVDALDPDDDAASA